VKVIVVFIYGNAEPANTDSEGPRRQVKSGVLTGAMILAVVAAFALFQAAAKGQPLHGALARLGRGGRGGARVVALVAVVGACGLLARAIGWTEAALLTTVALALVASAFVLLAAVAPRLAWGLALAAPVLAGVLVVGAEALP
jgi:hypothetical protein